LNQNQKANELLEELRRLFAEQKRNGHPCPSCGHCPTCGRGGYGLNPYSPWWGYQPTPFVYPVGEITWTTPVTSTSAIGMVTITP